MSKTALAHALRRTLARVPALLTALLLLTAVGCASLLWHRSWQKARGLGSAEKITSSLDAGPVGASGPAGSFTATIDYTLFGAAGDGTASTELAWDDAWFTAAADASSYNRELAYASAVLTAVAYSESGYYQASNDTPPYMEQALYDLGFTDVDTSSYTYRSEVVDEVLDAATMNPNGVAYTIARKRIVDAQAPGGVRELIAVIVRGSYGSEWVSNLDLTGDEASEAADELTRDRDAHHSGYRVAAEEILQALAPWREVAHTRGHEASVLLCGHSRGGAVAGLAAAMLDDELAAAATGGQAAAQASGGEAGGDQLMASAQASGDSSDASTGQARADKVFAYTFASPRTTVEAAAGTTDSPRYGNIFNVVSPADPVCALPLAAWGYKRYGTDMELPGLSTDGFAEKYDKMRAAYSRLTGGADLYDPDAEKSVRRLVRDVSAAVPTAADLMTPAGITSAAAACATDLDVLTILQGHYPSAYIAWLQVLE